MASDNGLGPPGAPGRLAAVEWYGRWLEAWTRQEPGLIMPLVTDDFEGVEVFELRGGLATRLWAAYDLHGLVKQLAVATRPVDA